MWVQALKRAVVGTPIATSLAKHERLGRVTGLAVFASDALSSVAYATEVNLLILILAGAAALHLSGPIGLAIILPESVPARWWQHLLHNQTALLIKGALLFRKGLVVINVPYHLSG